MSYYITSISYYLSNIVPAWGRNFYGDEKYLKNNIEKFMPVSQKEILETKANLKPIGKINENYLETFEDYVKCHPRWTIEGVKRQQTLYEIISSDIKLSEKNNTFKNNAFCYTMKILRGYNKQVLKKRKLNKYIVSFKI